MQQELLKEDVYTDYVRVGEINSEIEALNNEIEDDLTRWEEIQKEIEELDI